MTASEREKLEQDLEYLIGINTGEAKKRYEDQLDEIKKSR